MLNVLNAAYAGGADPTGAADSTAAIQAAINAAAYVSASDASGILGAAQATVYLPGGTYLISSGPLVLPHGHSIRITGAGDGTILKSTANAIIDFDGLNGLTEGSVEIDHLGFDAAGGHVFQNPNLHGQLHLHDLAIRQRSAGFSVFWADDTVTGHVHRPVPGYFPEHPVHPRRGHPLRRGVAHGLRPLRRVHRPDLGAHLRPGPHRVHRQRRHHGQHPVPVVRHLHRRDRQPHVEPDLA